MDLVTQLRHLQQLRDRYLAMHCVTQTILRSTREEGDKAFFGVHSQFPCVTRTSQLTVTVAPLSLPPPLPAQETQASLVRPRPSVRPSNLASDQKLPPPPPQRRRRRRVPTSSRAPLLPSLPHFPSLTLASSDLATTKKYLAPQQILDPKVG